MHDDFEPIGAIVERLVKKVAPAEGGETASATSRHSGGGTAVILQFDVSRCRPPRGAQGPAMTVLTASFPGAPGRQRRFPAKM